jgi:hypothetical protein
MLAGEDGVERDLLLQVAGLQQHPLVGVQSGRGHPAVPDDGLAHVAERALQDLFVERCKVRPGRLRSRAPARASSRW